MLNEPGLLMLYPLLFVSELAHTVSVSVGVLVPALHGARARVRPRRAVPSRLHRRRRASHRIASGRVGERNRATQAIVASSSSVHTSLYNTVPVSQIRNSNMP
eukprot:6208877-Pleurochrysis_carterae.AAC.3